ncbi:MAG: trimeric intracellular cation channel family protein [Ferruginibacter sp.]|nr:trimeric intracellular cation channel family protein [Ferruginibacter sp.]
MTVLSIISYMGIFFFALTGALKARAHKMDVFGGLVVAFVSAYGGGTLRDLLIGVRPVNWINDNTALLLVFAGTIITFFLKDNVHRIKRTIFFTDAAGIGLFTAVGIQVSLQNGLNEMYALIMGVITATFGGLIADVFCNDVPNLFKRGELYATACAAGGLVYLLLKISPLSDNINLAICVLIVVGLRIYSKRKRLMLPDI